MPRPEDRYQSLMIVSQDHSIWSEYGPQDVVLDEETVGTRYALLLLRTFLDPNDEEDVKAAHALQDAVTVTQADKGSFEYVYDDKGMFTVNEYDAYSYNSVTAKRNEDGSVTIHFGGDPGQDNFLPIVPGWNYIVRMYQPREEILEGTWTFPGGAGDALDRAPQCTIN